MSPTRLVVFVVAAAVVAGAVGYSLGSRRTEPKALRASNSPVIAEWNGGAVSADELSAWLEKKPAQLRSQLERGAGRRELLNELIDLKLAASEARRVMLADDPSLALDLDTVLSNRLTETQLRSPDFEPSEAELRQWFEAHRADFERPEMLRVRLIRLTPPAGSDPAATVTDARALAETLRRSLTTDPLAFGRTARMRSDDSSKSADGDLGWLTREQLASAVGAASIDAIWPAALDELLGPLADADAVRLVRVEGRRPGASAELAMVKNVVRDRLISERREAVTSALKQRLRAAANVSVHEDQLDAAPLTSR